MSESKASYRSALAVTLGVAFALLLLGMAVLYWIAPDELKRDFGFGYPDRIHADSGDASADALRVARQLIGARFAAIPEELFVYSTGGQRVNGGLGYLGYVKAKVSREAFDRIIRDREFFSCDDPAFQDDWWMRWDVPGPQDLSVPFEKIGWWDPRKFTDGDYAHLLGYNGQEFLKYENGYLYYQAKVREWRLGL